MQQMSTLELANSDTVGIHPNATGCPMAKPSGFRQLTVWQKSIALIARVYELTRAFPREELYGLTSQLRRAAVSVAANIAEGTGRWTKGEFRNSLSVACGSAKEVETLIEVALVLELVDATTHGEIVTDAEEISRMLQGLQRRLPAK